MSCDPPEFMGCRLEWTVKLLMLVYYEVIILLYLVWNHSFPPTLIKKTAKKF